MRIGFDFDNTIVNYDSLFHKVALEQGVIEHSVPVNKVAVREYLRAANREDVWTEMQGYVYGARMSEAEAYPGVIQAMRRLKRAGHTLAIVSHKTKHPYLGKQYDLHAAARDWITQSLHENGEPLIPMQHIFFELTKDQKIARIRDFGCEAFIDDLPEILLSPIFPSEVTRYLFDPEQHHQVIDVMNITNVPSWASFEEHLLLVAEEA
jgi:hypothetical protein